MKQGCESSAFNLISDYFALHKNPIFRLLMQFECIEKHFFSAISDYNQLRLSRISGDLANHFDLDEIRVTLLYAFVCLG